ncbi:MAG: recombinase family protein [Candidatus Omnitrophica bacterium]|nr:recombinase family protein [Candidatus Omnitrophota bacterium]
MAILDRKRSQASEESYGAMKNNKAISYLRCSTDMQDASIPEQKKAIEIFARDNDIAIVRHFDDEGRSGRNAEERPGFMEMKKTVETSDDFRFILVYDCTRFGRFKDPQEAVYWEVHFRKCGKIVKYVTDESANDNTLGGRLVKTLKHEQATQYALDLSKTSFRGHKHYAELGFHVGGMAKYGYKRLLVDESGRPVKILEYGEHKALKTQHVKLAKGNPDEVRTVQRIFDMYVNKGLGMTKITDTLNKEGVPPPIRRPKAMTVGWSKSTVWSILHDPTYIGWVVYNKNSYDNLLEQDKGWGRTKPQAEWVVNKTAHEPIVSEELFKGVAAKIKQSSFKNGGGHTSRYLLKGLIVCSICKARYQGRTTAHYEKGKKEYRDPYYVCGSYIMRGKHVCGCWSVPQKLLEGLAIQRIKKIIEEPSTVNRIRDGVKAKLEKSLAKNQGSHDIDKELGIVTRQMKNLTEAVANGFDRKMATERINELMAKRDRLEEMKSERRGITPIDVSRYTNKVEQRLREFKSFENLNIEKRRDLIKRFLYKIEIDSKERKCYYYFFKSPIIDDNYSNLTYDGKGNLLSSGSTLTTNLTYKNKFCMLSSETALTTSFSHK